MKVEKWIVWDFVSDLPSSKSFASKEEAEKRKEEIKTFGLCFSDGEYDGCVIARLEYEHETL